MVKLKVSNAEFCFLPGLEGKETELFFHICSHWQLLMAPKKRSIQAYLCSIAVTNPIATLVSQIQLLFHLMMTCNATKTASGQPAVRTLDRKQLKTQFWQINKDCIGTWRNTNRKHKTFVSSSSFSSVTSSASSSVTFKANV